MVKLHDNIEWYLSRSGLPQDVQKLSAGVEVRMREIFPRSFADFLAEYGFCSFFNRGFQLCNPDDMRGILSLVFEADKDFHHNDAHVFGYTAFGELYCWSNTLFSFTINLVESRIFCSKLIHSHEITATPDHLASGMMPKREYIDFYDVNDDPMLDRCIERYGQPDYGECYGFVPALGLVGGSDSPMNTIDHIQRVRAREHFVILAQVGQFNLSYSTGAEFKIVRPIG